MKMTEENNMGHSTVTVEDVQTLVKKKDDIEEQIKAYYNVLEDVRCYFSFMIWYETSLVES